ncbi:hypothetical protein CCACVL1_10545 [Corchorus capsularis]|uniref:Uncharacterized protein n=1 Tax=Corchorus capsularis TaxID=210143 RepID=A0A1R3IQU8_COCAP|nr:hypothetical protein CCACVL1_10545 [Corchorus capsularis]
MPAQVLPEKTLQALHVLGRENNNSSPLPKRRFRQTETSVDRFHSEKGTNSKRRFTGYYMTCRQRPLLNILISGPLATGQ